MKSTSALHRLALPLVVAAASAGAAPALAQLSINAWDPGTKFSIDAALAESPQSGCRFGFAVAMTDDVCVIGAPDVKLTDKRFNASTNGAGAAFVFKRTAATNTWTFVQRLIAPARELSQTGCAVAIDPVTQDIVVGAWGSNTMASFGGAAWVYRKGAGDSWGTAALPAAFGNLTRVPSQTLAPEELQPIDQFGFSVGIHNGTLAVGCPLAGASNTGAIYVFDRDSGGEYQFAQKLEVDGSGANDQVGTKVAIHGNLIVAGVQNDDVSGKLNAGSAVVWKRAAGTWGQAATLTATTPESNAGFGSSVAVVDAAEDWVAVGSPSESSGKSGKIAGNGATYVFHSTDNGASWDLDAKLLPRMDNGNNGFGFALAASLQNPPQLVVGAPGYDNAIRDDADPTQWTQVVNSGAAFCFVRSGGTWGIRGGGAIRGDLWSAAAAANSNMGRAVATGPTAPAYSIVAAETPTSSLGTAYPFEFRNAQIGYGDGNVSGPAIGELGANGQPTDGSNAGTGSGGTGGSISGGGNPGTGATSGPGAIVTPLTPIVYPWGTIKGSAVALSGRTINVLQTDGKQKGVKVAFQHLGDLPTGARYVGTGDMNGDNSGDIVFVAKGEVLKFWKRDGLSVLGTFTIDSLPVGYDAIKVGDFDANGKDDVLLRSVIHPREIEIWNIDGGAISSVTDYELPAGDWLVLNGSVRSKTSNDIILRDRVSGTVRVLVPDGTGGATFPVVAQMPPAYRVVGFGDVDANGQPDIFWQGKDTKVSLLATDDKGNYVTKYVNRVGFADAQIMNVRDWNDDGTLDVWMRRGGRNYIQYLKYSKGYLYGNGSRDLGNAPGVVVDISER